VILYIGAISFRSKPESAFKITFSPYYGNSRLALNTLYINKAGDSLYVEGFKFYTSNYAIKEKGKWKKLKNTYFLFNAEDSLSKNITLIIPSSTKIDSLRFLIGVDSLACVSGAMSGALDPLHGMFWTWNTGYINAKLEGHSNSCKTLHHAFEFHIGGYMQPYNTLREVKIAIKNTVQTNIRVMADKFMDGKETISLKKINSVVTPGKEAVMLANNYSDMFVNE
jgi:hypothetical protein